MAIVETIDVEKLLQWVYRSELPKQEVGGLTGWERLILLGTNVDVGRRDSDDCFPVALGPPDPLALQIDYVVRSLPAITINWPATRSALMHGMEGLLPADISPFARPIGRGHYADYDGKRDGSRFARAEISEFDDDGLVEGAFGTAGLVTKHAMMGTRPHWDLGPIAVGPLKEKNGKPAIEYLNDKGKLVRGRTKARHYGPMARCLLKYDPAPRQIVFARAEYWVWRSALDDVAEKICAWNLRDRIVTKAKAAMLPWIVDTEQRSRILRSSVELPRPEHKPLTKKRARPCVRLPS
jgi:hypothetical protein